jgi:isocitrate/isopropylmalate dehydrogenase
MENHKIAAVFGDGIGHEIVPVGIEVLQAAAKSMASPLYLITSLLAQVTTNSMASLCPKMASKY